MMTTPSRFATLAALALGLAACSSADPTAPTAQTDASLLVRADAGKSKGQNGGTVFEPIRLAQVAYWSAGAIKDYSNQPTTTASARVCELNSLEDLDGNDFVSFHDDTYTEEQINEKDGIVLVMEGPTPDLARRMPTDVYVGRAIWDATIWRQLVPGASSQLISINSNAQGVLAPLMLDGQATSQDAQDLLDLVWHPLQPQNPGYTFDLQLTSLSPNAEAVQLVNAVLTAAASSESGTLLRGIRCDWQQNGGWIKSNTITYEKNWPSALNGLFR